MGGGFWWGVLRGGEGAWVRGIRMLVAEVLERRFVVKQGCSLQRGDRQGLREDA
ncbi:hypothetical protein [Bartonella harrusi]|uniref:Uncharacterized protein n=1 Tax=Bartonella harrusi TaxID=2961895 RepID=A0ABY5ETG1_9HYPH|nr:hypothetical protein [Bartonella harrusi]UTO28146.1 hypothetical protein NMK50_08170 [Bartonella harrusi]UTO28150.1 hypothetical protein NMK50_08190 [Bartonella harrusi]